MATTKRRKKPVVASAAPEQPAALPTPKMTPAKKKAVIQRFIKVSIYTFLGIILSGAGYLAFTFLTDAQLPSWVVTFMTIGISGAAASVHKSINWVEAGVEPPAVAPPEIPSVSMPPMALPGPGSNTSQEG